MNDLIEDKSLYGLTYIIILLTTIFFFRFSIFFLSMPLNLYYKKIKEGGIIKKLFKTLVLKDSNCPDLLIIEKLTGLLFKSY